MFAQNRLNFAAIADLHFGHPKLNSSELYDHLVKHFYPKLEGLDILFIPGDIFHSLLNLDHLGSYYATMFLMDLLAYSERTGLLIRIVLGTFSHDRNQPKFVQALQQSAGHCRVITDIDLETIPLAEGVAPLKVVYLPDSLPYATSKDVVKRVQELFDLVGWKTADLLVGHGAFAHALPDTAPVSPTTYQTEQFDELITGHVIMGHIHTPSRTKKVIYVGSFDRMCHGEEHKKGFLTGTMDWQRKWSFKFHENTSAIKFMTIQPQGDTPDEAVADFEQQVILKFPDLYGHVRVLHEDVTIRSVLHHHCNRMFPKLQYTSKAITAEAAEGSLQAAGFHLEELDTLVLDLPNLIQLIYEQLREQPDYCQYSLSHYQTAVADLGVR